MNISLRPLGIAFLIALAGCGEVKPADHSGTAGDSVMAPDTGGTAGGTAAPDARGVADADAGGSAGAPAGGGAETPDAGGTAGTPDAGGAAPKPLESLSFVPGPTTPAGTNAVAVVIGDLDGDGDGDLAVADQAGGGVRILLNHGDATFAEPVAYATDAGPASLAIADLDGDGDLDLAVANHDGGNVSVLLNRGDATFARAANYTTDAARAVAIGDLDGNGTLDLAVLSDGGYATSSAIRILLNDGRGSFSATTPLSFSGPVGALAMADLNGDGYADLLVSYSDDDSSPTTAVYLGSGNGTFSAHAGYAAWALAVADLDGDGTRDVVAWSYSGLRVSINDGKGTFGRASSLDVGRRTAGSVAVADLDGDGTPDLVTNRGSVMLGTGHGVFGEAVAYVPATSGGVAVADLNGDGHPDLVFASGALTIRLNAGDGTFGPDRDYRTDQIPAAVALADLNGDGRLDLAVASHGGGKVDVRLGLGGGTFGAMSSYPAGSYLNAIAVADLDRDGKPDLAIANAHGVAVLLNLGNATYDAPISLPTGGAACGVAAADLDGDGDTDLAVANCSASSVSVLLNNGDATFATTTFDAAFSTRNAAIAVGDFDGDGRPDLVVGGSGDLSVMFNDRNGGFGRARPLVDGAFQSVAVADLDGDGNLDLAAGMRGGALRVALGNGDGTVKGIATYNVDSSGNYGGYGPAVTLGDLDGDGRPDAMVGADAFVNRGDGTFASGVALLGVGRRRPGSAPRWETSTATAGSTWPSRAARTISPCVSSSKPRAERHARAQRFRRSCYDRQAMTHLIRLSCAGLLLCMIGVASCGGGGGKSGSGSGGSNGAAGANSTGGVGGASGDAGGGAGGSGGSGGAAGDAAGSAGNVGASGGAAVRRAAVASGSGGVVAAAGSGGAGGTGLDGGSTDPCGHALFCETFDGYPTITTIADKQKLGPWHAALTTGATMNLDGAHKTSGSSALHVHIDNAVTAGGRLFSDGAQPIFASKPTHVYGRMKMYIDPNGTSVHWTFFGVNGAAEPSSPAAGRDASYILSSLPNKGVNTYSFVYGLQATATEAYHDCSSQSGTSMPTGWACVSFEMDSVARTLRMYKDGAPSPILSVDDHGNGCVAPTPVTSPWYGPAITQLFAGAWSFHDMTAPLDVWIDDLVVDTKPVTCPPP